MSDINHEAKTQKKRKKPGNWKKPEKPNPDKGVCVYARVSVSDSSYITSFELQKKGLSRMIEFLRKAYWSKPMVKSKRGI